MTASVWLKPGLIGAAGGAIALAVLGFYAGGWMTGTKAETLASSRANSEAVAAQVPYCLEYARTDPARASVMQELADAPSYQRDTIVMETGWATVPGESRPDRKLAAECAKMLMSKT